MTTIVESVSDLRARCDEARSNGLRVGLVPTMGHLHRGHRSLMERARDACDLVVTSVFVNPLQFGVGEDLDRYPRDLTADLAACEAERVDVLFHPSLEEMYPGGEPQTVVHVGGLTEGLCGRARPTHFDGVATVVAKLFAITGPCTAFFGRKDFQQLLVVRRLASDLNLPVAVVGCPIVREPDGLALSSRNAYLAGPDRAAATVLYRSLVAAVDRVAGGERSAATVRDGVADRINAESRVELDYAEVRRAADLDSIDVVEGQVLIAVAARVGSTRLIDNVRVRVAGEVSADLGLGGPSLVSQSVGELP